MPVAVMTLMARVPVAVRIIVVMAVSIADSSSDLGLEICPPTYEGFVASIKCALERTKGSPSGAEGKRSERTTQTNGG